jgi:SWI/SNF-related matrix-associated actin-dependent regulator of chromatin subfamily D
MITLTDFERTMRAAGMPPSVAHTGYQQYTTPSTHVGQQEARREELRRQERAKMLSRKPTDRDMPAGVDEIAIGGAVERYQKLRELERKLDATMMRKRLDIQDQPRDVKRRRTMRIWISNAAENQPWQATGMDAESFDFGDSSQATYRVKIEGRLLDEEDVLDVDETKGPDTMDTDGENTVNKTPVPGEMTKLSHFFKKITIDFDRPPSLQPDNMAQIEWIKPESREGVVNTADAANFDCLHFERKSDENINVGINMYPDNQPEVYRLSEELSQICGGIKEDTKANITMNVWKYIRVNKLDGGEDARKARCDALMKNVRDSPFQFAKHILTVTGLWLRHDRAQPRWRCHNTALPTAPAYYSRVYNPRR